MDKGEIIQNICKTDYDNTTTLKNEVKKLLVKEIGFQHNSMEKEIMEEAGF